MIGANNYGFADIVQRCVDELAHVADVVEELLQRRQRHDVALHRRRAIATETTNVRNALLHVRDAMANAGYSTSQYTILAQTYWSPIPRGVGLPLPRERLHAPVDRRLRRLEPRRRLGQRHGRHGAEQTTRNAAATSGLPNVTVLDLQTALNGRRLCENTVGLLEEKGVAAWTSAGAVDKTEWVAQIRTTSTIFGPYQLQESSHASYWGQLAMRNCLRQAYNGGARARRQLRADRRTGSTRAGEPKMTLQP